MSDISLSASQTASQIPWPELPLAAWRDTYATLHLWSQIVGKIRTTRSPWLNHSWHVTLYVTARGLSTSPIPDGTRYFQIDFDFIDHALRISASDGATHSSATFGWTVSGLMLQTQPTQSNLDGDSVSLALSAHYHGTATLSYGVSGLPTASRTTSGWSSPRPCMVSWLPTYRRPTSCARWRCSARRPLD